MSKVNSKTVLEYIWIGGNGELRSKTRVINSNISLKQFEIPNWNYDGSSTNQADSNKNTEIILSPCSIFKNPLLTISDCDSYLILCDTYDINEEPIPTNTRHRANEIFEQDKGHVPWFGLEQEYFIIHQKNDLGCPLTTEGKFYCGTQLNITERTIAEEHLRACLDAGIQISGINAEVAKSQWEFQVGPCEGISAGDHLYVARFLLERIAEKYGASISYTPKLALDQNGSGCHTNFSTLKMRNKDGIKYIFECMEKLENNHKEHIEVYGEDNDKRLTGKHETSSMEKFSYGVGTRNTSIRIPNQTLKESCGYFEDRRPAANMDPYLVTSIIFKTCCL